ncbi:hypothetical protein [Pelotomaculum propionicicum]|uniref:hypothetical protein n=1 Tax=Pelotomaculum propionicicum TaxID=258475 RepID=UPI003B9EF122
MTGASVMYKSYTREESLKYWTGNERPDFEGQGQLVGNTGNEQTDTVELSDQAKEFLAKMSEQSNDISAQGKAFSGVTETDNSLSFELSEEDKQKIMVVQKMIEALTGKKIKFRMMVKLKINEGNSPAAGQASVSSTPAQGRQGWGLEYNYHESYYEQEKMSFAAQGIVRTADGREIDFSVNLKMSHEFASRLDINIRAGDAAIDPLVINLNGNAPELTDTKYSFDIDCDGLEDQISFVGPDSGFLALDINEDGQINNGGELFGPGSGDGFAELAQYDEDGNGWIDEADSIYSRLRIWTKDSEGKDVLFALGQKGVGAIFLGSTGTPFEIKDEENNLDGVVRNSGVFLYESGLAGTVQQIDLAV